MKRTIFMVLAILMVLAFAACAPTDSADTADTAATDDTAEDVTNTPADDDADINDDTDTDADDVDTDADDTDTTPISVATLAGPTGMGMVQMMNNAAYDISIYTAPDQLSPKIISGEVDVAAIPSNLGAVLYNKLGGGIKVVGINTMGVLYILENGDTVSSIEDLAGKTIYATGQGATPEYVLNKILEENGLEDVTVEYMGAHADLANALAAGEVTLAMLPEPFVSIAMKQNSSLAVKLDINEEWQAIFGEDAGIPMGIAVVSDAMAADSAAMEQLIADYTTSVKYVTSDAAAASEAIVEAGIFNMADVTANAIPRCGISFITGEDCKALLEDYFEVMYAFNPDSIAGALPDDGFYYIP